MKIRSKDLDLRPLKKRVSDETPSANVFQSLPVAAMIETAWFWPPENRRRKMADFADVETEK